MRLSCQGASIDIRVTKWPWPTLTWDQPLTLTFQGHIIHGLTRLDGTNTIRENLLFYLNKDVIVEKPFWSKMAFDLWWPQLWPRLKMLEVDLARFLTSFWTPFTVLLYDAREPRYTRWFSTPSRWWKIKRLSKVLLIWAQILYVPVRWPPVPARGPPVPARWHPVAARGPLPARGPPVPASGPPVPVSGPPVPARVLPVPSRGSPVPTGGLLCRPEGLLCRPDGLLYRPEGLLYRPEDLLCRPEGLLCRPEGLLCRPDGLLYRPQGLLCRPEGLLCRPDILLYRSEGLLYRPEGLLFQQEDRLCQSVGLLCRPEGLLYRPEGLLCRREGLLFRQDGRMCWPESLSVGQIKMTCTDQRTSYIRTNASYIGQRTLCVDHWTSCVEHRTVSFGLVLVLGGHLIGGLLHQLRGLQEISGGKNSPAPLFGSWGAVCLPAPRWRRPCLQQVKNLICREPGMWKHPIHVGYAPVGHILLPSNV